MLTVLYGTETELYVLHRLLKIFVYKGHKAKYIFSKTSQSQRISQTGITVLKNQLHYAIKTLKM